MEEADASVASEPEVQFSRADDGSPEQQFAKQAGTALRTLAGRVFQTPKGGAQIELTKVKRPVVHRREDSTDYVVQVIVSYAGNAPPEEWAGAERAMEREVLGLLKANAPEDMAGIKMVSRVKSDPFTDDPATLTLLRFRV
jgi:hypothetical protein